MSLRHRVKLVLLLLLSLVAITAMAADILPAKDAPGSHDHSLISRFPGSVIIGYQHVDFDQAVLPMGKDADDKLTKTKTVAGKITRLVYAVPMAKSTYEVFQNYAAALKQAGFVTQFQCQQEACGPFFSWTVFNGLSNDTLGGGNENYNLRIDILGGRDVRSLTAHLDRPQGNVDVSLMVVGNSGKSTGVLLQIVEEKAMTTNEVTINAKAMSHGLAQNGHIALYGIHFATDSATLTLESSATLKQMATLLKSQSSLKVYIVGHTDNTGALKHNLALSKERATSVVTALVTRGITASRMVPQGMASFAPVASNDSDVGRAKNRRVELVKQ